MKKLPLEIPGLLKQGISSLKVFTAYNHRLRLQDGEIFKVLRIARQNGMLVMAHCENGDVIDILVKEALQRGDMAPIWHARTRPAWGEIETILRMISLSAQAEAMVYIVHMTTSGGVNQVQRARQNGLAVMGETCPQYLFFTEKNLLQDDGAKWICSPPVRTEKDQDGLWQGLAHGNCRPFATDHCPFFFNVVTQSLMRAKKSQFRARSWEKNDFTKIPNGFTWCR